MAQRPVSWEPEPGLEHYGAWGRFRDDDGDGLHDGDPSTGGGLSEADYEQRRRSTIAFARQEAAKAPWRDANSDGLHDDNGLTAVQFDRLAKQASGSAERSLRALEEQSRTQWDRDDRARAAEESAAYTQQYEEYVRSGQRTRDLDAGKEPWPRPGSPSAPGYRPPTGQMRPGMAPAPGQGGGGSGGYAQNGGWGNSLAGGGGVLGGGGGGGANPYDTRPQWQRDYDSVMSNIPLVGDGSQARDAQAQEALQQAQNRALWGGLSDTWYSADDLAVDYETGAPERSEAAGAAADQMSIDAQRNALTAMQDVYQSGGMTAADRARQQLARQQTGMAMRANRDADLAALEARGMATSGANLQSRLAAQQMGSMALSSEDAQMQIAAQQRALQAMQNSGAMAGQMRGQSFDESYKTRNAADQFNQWRHGLATKSRESRADARQYAEGRRERQVAGMTGQYQGDANLRSRLRDEENEADARTAGAIGSLIGTITG